MHKESTFWIMLKMVKLVKPLALYLLLAVVLGVIGFLCAIFIPYLCALVISHIAIDASAFPISVFLIMLVVLAILRGILHYGEQACNHFIAFKLLAILRDRVFQALRRLAPAKIEGKEKGELIYLITSDIEALEVFYAHTISPILIAILTSMILLYQFYTMHILFFFIAFLAYLFTGCCIPLIIMKRGKKDGEEAKQAFATMSSYTLESIRSMQDILQYQIGEKRLQNIEAFSDIANDKQKTLKNHEGNSMALATMSVTLFSIVMFFTGCYFYLQNDLSFTSVLMATVLMLSSFGPVLALSSLSNHLLMTMASARRVFSLLEEEPKVQEVEDKQISIFDTLYANHIHFAYAEECILDDITYELKKGQITGILGKSGSGKSTLLKLLMRFFLTSKGTISIGKRDLNVINTAELRQMQSYVTQETVLFHDTIFNNIHIANLDASIADVENACKKAQIHEFIMSLPKEYATTVTELGDSLSGGEKQRIALARAFLHDGECILLDEPTSNLDALHEALILKTLQQQKDKTIVLVSHRPGTLKIAHRVLSMESGRVC